MGKDKKSSGAGFAAIIAAGAIFLSQKSCGTGFGTGNEGLTGTQTGVSEQSDNPNETPATEAEVTAAPQIIIDITIDGRDYIYDNKKVGLAELTNALSNIDKSAEIRISCENSATVNAKENLVYSLETNGFKNIIVK
ncbi:MAG: hypothetical protein IKV85_02555 [Ruminococcus sp.]|nr:hypothetical protein [Ruminococcus sp.]